MIIKRIQDLPANSAGDRQIEPHQIDDNLGALEGALLSVVSSLVQTGGVAVPGAVVLTDTNLRVQGRTGITLDGAAPVQVIDQTVSLAALAAGKKRVVVVPAAQTVARTYTDVVTSQVLTDQMIKTLGTLVVIGAGDAGVTLDAQGYPVCPQAALPVATITRTAGGATLDQVENPSIVLRGAAGGAGGSSAVVHDGTLTGDGTPTSPLSSPGGLNVSNAHLAKDGVQIYDSGAGAPQLEYRANGSLYALPLPATGPKVVARSPSLTGSEGFGGNLYRIFTPIQDVTLVGLRDTVAHGSAGAYVVGAVWQVGTSGAPLGITGDTDTSAASAAAPYTALFAQPITLHAGVGYLIGWYGKNGQVKASNVNPETLTYAGFDVGKRPFYSGGSNSSYPDQTFTSDNVFNVTFDLLVQ